MNSTERARLLRTYPVLEELPAPLLNKVEGTAAPVHASAGHRLFSDGSPCAFYPLLIEGTIRVSKISPDGHEILLYRLNPGESCVITVVTLLGEVPYPAIGTAETELALLAVPRSVFMEIILESPPFRVFVFNALSQRIANLMASSRTVSAGLVGTSHACPQACSLVATMTRVLATSAIDVQL